MSDAAAAPTPQAVFLRRRDTSGIGLLIPITLLFGLLVLAALRSPALISPSGFGSAMIVLAPLTLATYALMATVIAGRGTVDLAIGPLIGFINVSLIQLTAHGMSQNLFVVFGFCILAGVAYQVLMALAIIYVRVQPIIVSLSGYLAMTGINMVILPRPGGMAPQFMATWGYGTTIFSPILLIVVLATAGWLLFKRTAFYTHLRLMGSDERAAYTAGIPIYKVRIGAHVISGIYAGLAAICFTALISSGDPSQGTNYTLSAVTALVLGGASLAGGRASVAGSLIGAVNIYLISYSLSTFNFGSMQSYVTQLSYGAVLVASLVLTLALPHIQRRIRSFSPTLFFIAVASVALGVALHAVFDYRDLAQAAPVLSAPELYSALVIDSPAAGMGSLFGYWLGVVFVALTIPVMLRLLVSRSSRANVHVAVYVVIAAIILLLIFALSTGLGSASSILGVR
ncbi:ABC transporter permease [Cognatishimia sp. D5M38]|jgi:ribose transport system permease protein|uniref:ABC transporter permease n=1 Tax=Cognatishimia coralii TaxID=3083254 RepID=A0ABU8QK40_9RHOB|nr:ABC transporter permease [Sulfitobacter sp. PR48]MDD9722831.1 ABC transporter permease [Sulfitobacter sp. PR48]